MSLFVSLLAAPAAAAPAKPAARAPQTLQISGDDVRAISGLGSEECAIYEQNLVKDHAGAIAERILVKRASEYSTFNEEKKAAARNYLAGKIEAKNQYTSLHAALVNNQRWHGWECHKSDLVGALTLRGLSSTDVFDLKVPVQELHNAIAEGEKIQPPAPAPYQPPLPLITSIDPTALTAGTGIQNVSIKGNFPALTASFMPREEENPNSDAEKCFTATITNQMVANEIRIQIDTGNLRGVSSCKFEARNNSGSAEAVLGINSARASSSAPRPRPAPPRPAPAPAATLAPTTTTPPAPAKPKPTAPKPTVATPPLPSPAPAEGSNPFEL